MDAGTFQAKAGTYGVKVGELGGEYNELKAAEFADDISAIARALEMIQYSCSLSPNRASERVIVDTTCALLLSIAAFCTFKGYNLNDLMHIAIHRQSSLKPYVTGE